MATQKTFALAPGANLSSVVELAKQNLVAGGYDVNAMVLNENTATMTITKDRDGFKNIVGLGVEATVSLTVLPGGTLTANIEDVWTNKIVAMAVGWFVCLIPFITGIVGCSEQSGLKNKISNALMMAVSSAQ